MTDKPKLGRALAQLHDGLLDLAEEYEKAGERHASDHDVFHVTRMLAAQCELQAQSLEPHAARYGRKLESGKSDLFDVLFTGIRRLQAASLAKRPVTGMLLLRDLRQLHLAIEEAAMLWLVVGQAAQAVRDRELLEVVERAREEMTKQILWVTTRIKEAAPQVLAA